jgi:mRNA interferase YafQ
MEKQGRDLSKLKDVITQLANGGTLPPHNRDHPLKGNYADCRECHVGPDWLLIYKVSDDELTLLRTGSHSELF